MLRKTYKNRVKKVIAVGLLSTMCITSLGITQTNAATFTQTSIPQQSSNVANGEILTTTSFNSVVSDIGNLVTDIDGLKTYIGDKYTELKDYVDNLFTNLQITTAEIVDGTIKKEDLDPNLDLGIWKKGADGSANYTGSVIIKEDGNPTNAWKINASGTNQLNFDGPNSGSKLGLQKNIDSAIVEVGNSINDNASLNVYGDTNITRDIGFKGILKGWLASLNDYIAFFKGSVGNPTTGSQDIHILPDFTKGGDKSGTASMKLGYNSEIDNYSFYSKIGGSNENIFSIDAKNNKTKISKDLEVLGNSTLQGDIRVGKSIGYFDSNDKKILFSGDKWLSEDTTDGEILELRQHTAQGKPGFKITDQNGDARFMYQMKSNNISINGDSDRAIFGLRHLGADNNPIEIKTEDTNDDGIILTSNGKDVAKFKKNLITYNQENSFKGFQNINDIRGNNYGPDWYADKSMHFGFVEASTLGLPSGTEGWAYVQTINKWDNSNQAHKIYQIALNSDKMYMRTNADATTWRAWKEVGGNSSSEKNLSYFETDRENHSVGTSMTVIKTWLKRTIQSGKKLKVSIHIPLRNDSTSWGGAYVGLEVNVNGGGWKKIGDSGHDIMTYDAKGIMSYNNTFEFNPYLFGITEGTPYTIQFRTLARSYDGTTYINKNHNINKYGEDYRVGAFYHNLYIEEKDWEGWTAQEGDVCDSSNEGKMYFARRGGENQATYCDGTYWRNYGDNHCTYGSITIDKKQYYSQRDNRYGRMADYLRNDGYTVDGQTEADNYWASGYTAVRKEGRRRNRSSAWGTKIIENGCTNVAPAS